MWLGDHFDLRGMAVEGCNWQAAAASQAFRRHHLTMKEGVAHYLVGTLASWVLALGHFLEDTRMVGSLKKALLAGIHRMSQVDNLVLEKRIKTRTN